MKRKLLLLLLPIILVCGCLPASQQEIQTLTGNVSRLLEGVDVLQDTTRQLAADGLINAEKVDKINAEIDKVQVHTETILEEVETAPDVISGIASGWEKTKDINPWYGYGVLALGILRMWQKRKESDTALEEVVFGVEDSKKNGTKIKEALLASNSTKTRKKVSKILGES